MRKYQEQVSKGIRLLNNIYPDWSKKINLEDLDLEDTKCCILGQLYGDYYRAKDGMSFSLKDTIEHGFTADLLSGGLRDPMPAFQELTQEWVFQVSEGGFSEE